MAEGAPQDRVAPSTFVRVGCLTAIIGFFGGGMIMVFVGKVIESFRGCQPPEGLPACNWGSYAAIGMVVGMIGLPLVSIMRLRGRRS